MSMVDHYMVLNSVYVERKLQSIMRLPTITTI